jgi:H+/Cl- antiporter ClcA
MKGFHGTLVWAGLVGILGALVTVGFREGIRLMQYLLTGRSGRFAQVSASIHPLQRMLIPTVGGILAGLILQYGTRLTRGSKSSDYMEAVTLGDGFISVRVSLVRSASSLCTIGSGGSIGREGAMVHLAALVGSSLGRLLQLPAPSRRLLVACGAAAGIASAYNAPLAATLFVAEILMGSLELEDVGPLLVSSVLASTTIHQVLGYAPIYGKPVVQLGSGWEMFFFLLLGVLAGYLAPAFLWLLETSHKLFNAVRAPVFVRFSLGGLAVGLLSVVEPKVWGNGNSVVFSILHNPWTWAALLTVLICKLLATTAMVGSGAVGGVFTPTLFIGAALGALLGNVVHDLFPGWTGTPATYAVIGMGAFLAGTTHAPLMSILMVFEMTGDYDVVLPLMLATTAAHYVAKTYRNGKSMYFDSLHRKIPLAAPSTAVFTLAQLIRKDQPTVLPDASPEKLTATFNEIPFNNLQVVDADHHWVGVIGRKSLSTRATAKQLVDPSSKALYSSMTLEEALLAASDIPSEMLPIVESSTYQFLGTVTKSDLLKTVQRQLRDLREQT